MRVLTLVVVACAAVGCRDGARRGTRLERPDPIVGCWRAPDGRDVNFDAERYEGTLLGSGAWRRETETLVSLASDDAGTPETLEATLSADELWLSVAWRELGSCRRFELEECPP